jgi:hypothetical protein
MKRFHYAKRRKINVHENSENWLVGLVTILSWNSMCDIFIDGLFFSNQASTPFHYKNGNNKYEFTHTIDDFF